MKKILLVLPIVTGVAACQMTPENQAAVTGGVAGAALGAAVSKDGKRFEGAALGAAAGTVAGP